MDSIVYAVNGCFDTIIVSVVPSVNINAPDTTACPGDTLSQMTADLSGGFWNVFSAVNSSIDTSGFLFSGYHNDSVQVFDTITYSLTGCSDTILVLVFPIPQANAVNNGSACVESSLSLGENGGVASSWSWSGPGNFSSTMNTPTVSSPQTGDYIVEITTQDGCTSKDTISICAGGVTANCNNQTLKSDLTGKVFLDSAAIGLGSMSSCAGISALSLSDSVLACENGFEQTITLIASDSSGCVDSCTATITIQDTIQPVEACKKMEQLVLVWQGLEVMPASLIGSSTDNCGADYLEFSFSEDFSKASFDVSCREFLKIVDTLTVYMRDASNNVSSCSVAFDFDLSSGENCECDWGSLKLKGRISADDYKANENITGTGYITGGDTVTMKASKSITLGPGFRVDAGSTLFCRIDSCGNFQPPMGLSKVSQTNQLVSSDGNDRSDDSENEMQSGNSKIKLQAFPTPFSSMVNLVFDIPEDGKVSLQLYQLLGGAVYRLMENTFFTKGPHELKVDATRIPAGNYVFVLAHDGTFVSYKTVKIE